MSRRVGLIVNPIAGMGGRVGLKGTDGPELLRRARERGAVAVAPERAARALRRLAEHAATPLELLTAPGPLGGDAAQAAGLPVRPLPLTPPADGATTAADTRAAATALAEADVDLLLFAGGDGTARDVNAAVAGRVPILGIPAGVKMHSGCFGATPEAAGEAAAAYLRAPGPNALVEVEIADAAETADGAAASDAPPATVLHGVARVPRAPTRILGAKQRFAVADDAALDGACARVAADVDPAALTIFGPGTTTARIERALDQDPAVLGVDAYHDGRLVARDASEAELLALLDAHPTVHLVLGVVGGQGSLLGRGNQQLSPAVLRRIDRSHLTVVADRRKLLALGTPPQLRVDTGDHALDQALSGHVPVRVAARETMMCELVS